MIDHFSKFHTVKPPTKNFFRIKFCLTQLFNWNVCNEGYNDRSLLYVPLSETPSEEFLQDEIVPDSYSSETCIMRHTMTHHFSKFHLVKPLQNFRIKFCLTQLFKWNACNKGYNDRPLKKNSSRIKFCLAHLFKYYHCTLFLYIWCF